MLKLYHSQKNLRVKSAIDISATGTQWNLASKTKSTVKSTALHAENSVQLGLMVASPVKFFSTNLVLICHCKSHTSFAHALLPFAFSQIVLIVELVTELSCRASTFTVNGVISPWT